MNEEAGFRWGSGLCSWGAGLRDPTTARVLADLARSATHLVVIRPPEVLLASAIALTLSSPAQAGGTACEPARPSEPLKIVLLTAGPGNEVASKWGHSALWVSGAGRDATVFNWGVYDFKSETFLWDFLQGTAEYELLLRDFARTLEVAREQDQYMVGHTVQLPPAAMARLAQALEVNARPANRRYVYHWFKKNCATVIRDLVDDATEGALQPLKGQIADWSPREESLASAQGSWPVWLGWHFMINGVVDRPYVRWDMPQMPSLLLRTFEEAMIPWPDGSAKPLLGDACVVNPGSNGPAPLRPPVRWPWLWAVGALQGLLFGVASSGRGGRTVERLAGLGLMAHGLMWGTLGTLVMLLWGISALEGFGPNENHAFANPLTFALIPLGWRLLRGRGVKARSPVLWALVGLAVLGWLVQLLPQSTQVNVDFLGLLGFPLMGLGLGAWRAAAPPSTAPPPPRGPGPGR